MGWLRNTFGGPPSWVVLLPGIKRTVHKNNIDLFNNCVKALRESKYKIENDALSYEMETGLEAWRLGVTGACVAYTKCIPKSDDEDFWGSLCFAIADSGDGSSGKKEIVSYIPYFKRYSDTGYPIKKPVPGYGVNLVAEDLAERILNDVPEKAVKILESEIVQSDKIFCYEIAEIFRVKDRFISSSMFNWL
jgi:hypothetical protein